MNPLPLNPHHAGDCALIGAGLFGAFGASISAALIEWTGAPYNWPAMVICFALVGAYAVVGFYAGAYWSLRPLVRRLRDVHASLQRMADDPGTR